MDPSPNSKTAFDWLSDMNREIFFGTLDSFNGAKVIVWDPLIIKRFDLIAKPDQLKQHDVVSMLVLGSGPLIASVEHNHVLYILEANMKSIRKLLIHIKHAASRDDHCLYHALIVPDALAIIKERLLENKESKTVLKTVLSLPLRIYPIHNDFFTFFMPDAAARILLHKDWIEIHKCASAIVQIQQLCRKVPNIRCSGKWAAETAKIVKEIGGMKNKNLSFCQEWDVSDIVIIDRWLDPLTPLLYQFTYAGLIDEIFNILPSGGIMTTFSSNDLEESRISKEKSLNDDLFASLRDLHISDIGKIISAELEEVKNIPQENWDASLTQTKVLVRRLREMNKKKMDIDKHTVIASYLTSALRDDMQFKKITRLEREILRGDYGDRVIPFIEDLIAEAYPAERILSLLAMQTLICGGLKAATFATYQRLFVQTYGLFTLTSWMRLQLAGLLFPKQCKVKCDYSLPNFHLINKRYKCFDQPSDRGVAYPYCGYVPPLVRHIESGVKNGWKEWTTVSSPHQLTSDAESTTVLCVLGGLTLAEMACLRQIKFPNQIIVLTSSLITGARMLQSVCSS